VLSPGECQEDVLIRSRGELRWIMEERGWTGEARTDVEEVLRVNLSGANLREINLTAQQLNGANLSKAHLNQAILRDVGLRAAQLQGTHFDYADLSGVDLRDARMVVVTDLRYAILDSRTLGTNTQIG
jgi:uncharacterized protein YjbI with pentapeptide repeats